MKGKEGKVGSRGNGRGERIRGKEMEKEMSDLLGLVVL